MRRHRSGGRVIDASTRFRPAQLSPSEQASPSDSDEAQSPQSGPRVLGQRADGTIELAAWRAQWRSIFKADFAMEHADGPADEGSLHIFHDPRSSSLEFMARAQDASVRHVLSPVQVMRLLVALNAAYGFDPKGPDGRPISDHEDDSGPGPMTA